MHIIKSTIYLHEGEVGEGGSLFRLGNGLERGLCTCPENLTSEWKMARFGAFCVLFLQTAVI